MHSKYGCRLRWTSASQRPRRAISHQQAASQPAPVRWAAGAALPCAPPKASLLLAHLDSEMQALTLVVAITLAGSLPIALGSSDDAAPLPQGGATCSTARDCQLAGECTAGKCVCDPGWAGASCSQLDLAPLTAEPAAWNSEYSSRSSWGGERFPGSRLASNLLLAPSCFSHMRSFYVGSPR